MTVASQSASSSAGPVRQGSQNLYQFFAPGGLLSRTHRAYEFRRQQWQLAQAVEQALEEHRHLIAEAGTGTGKTLAYLVPAIRSGKRVLISTGTKNLQEQLFYKDIPFLEQALFPNGESKLKVCYMKGRGNYLCRKKLYDLADQPMLSGVGAIAEFQAIADWEKTTHTGDRSELAGLPEDSPLWPKLDARSETCLGRQCAQWERCFITEMHRRALESDIIIVNHHLFFADLAIKQTAENAPDAGILPEVDAVIFDEAHELEDIAGSYFGVSLSNARVEDLIRDVEASLERNQLRSSRVLKATRTLRERSQSFFALLPPGDGRFAFDNRPQFRKEHGDPFDNLLHSLTVLEGELDSLPEKREEVFSFQRRAQELGAQLRFLLESEDRNLVFWIERRGGAERHRGRKNVFLQATPIDVAPILKACLFNQVPSVVLTSATLAVGGGFEYIRQRLGIDYAQEIILPPHFDYPKQAILYVPPELADPRSPQFAAQAGERIRELLAITRGRAFCLFTSYAQMKEIHQRLAGQMEFPMLLQGSAPKSALLEQFRVTPHAVLFATSAFWQGVDVQGEQLSCVIIDRLPFAVPSDPVVAARMRCLEEAGGNAFLQYQVPSAVITLKQGFGRLIRSLDDRGLLCLLDNRILKKHYGRVFLESLPNYRKTTRFEDVVSFFKSTSGA